MLPIKQRCPYSTTILIVCTGPAGLATALPLIHHGFRDPVIVDGLQHGKNTSRALIVHAATLEALGVIRCGDVVKSQGIRMNLTERVLGAKLAPLGVTVHWHLITTKYAVGADSVRSSRIRVTAGIGFSNPMNEKPEKVTNLTQMVFADMSLELRDGLFLGEAVTKYVRAAGTKPHKGTVVYHASWV